MRINENRPIERLIGSNAGIVRQRLGNVHCMKSIRAQLRDARPRNLRQAPPALRRGWALEVLEAIRDHRQTYLQVCRGNFALRLEVTRRD